MAPPASGSGAVAAGLIARKRKRIIRAFRESGAIGPDTAKSFGEVGLSRSLLVHSLKLRHILVDVGGDRFYLDTAREREVARARKLTVAAIVVVVVIVVIVLWRLGLM